MNTTKRLEYYTCRRLRLLEYLTTRGFQPYMTLPDVKNPKYNVWRFENTPELEAAVNAYFAAMKQRQEAAK